MIEQMELRTVPRQAQHIETILRQAISVYDTIRHPQQDEKSHLESLEFLSQVSKACSMSGVTDLQRHLTEATTAMESSSLIDRQKSLRDLAKIILRGLDKDPLYPTDLVDDRALATAKRNKSGGSNYLISEAPGKWLTPPLCLFESELSEIIAVEGTIQNRRRFEEDITIVFLDDCIGDGGPFYLDGKSLGKAEERLECVLHPRIWKNRTNARSYCGLLGVGSRVSLRGIPVYDRSGGQGERRPIVWVKDIQLVRSSSQPSTIYHLLEMTRSGGVDIAEIAPALGLSQNDEVDIFTDGTSKDLKWKANHLSASLQIEQTKMNNPSTLSDNTRATIEKYRHLLNNFPIHPAKKLQVESSQDMLLHDNRSDSLASRWQTKKLPQVKWMCEKIQQVLEGHPYFGKRRLSVLDVGGGKGMLANYLSRTIENVEIHVVDISAGAIFNGMKKVERSQSWKEGRPLSMVNFQLADASSSKMAHIHADIVVGLHACGHLTDVALSHAVQRRASFVIVPCCFNSNPHLTIPIDTSDSRTLVHEWLDLPEQDWSNLKYVAEIQGDVATASLGMHLLCSVRADAVKKKLRQDNAYLSKPIGDVNIVSFPIEYSTRNIALVGKMYE
jgi:SAM-dependent methyltransferase